MFATANLTNVDFTRRAERYAAFDEVHGAYLDWQMERFLPFIGDRILEVGCGVGGIMARLPGRSLVHGVDVEPEVLEIARERFAGRDECRFSLLDIASCGQMELTSLAQSRFDTVICVNVLEHIRDDIAALQRMESLLARGGYLLLLVPAHLKLYGAYDQLDGHFRRYSRDYLKIILRQTNFEIRQLRYFNAVGALGWWYHYCWRKGTMHGTRQFAAMQQLIPFLRIAERWLPPPFGLSVVAILQRPGKLSTSTQIS